MVMTLKNSKFLSVIECDSIFQFDVMLTNTLTSTITVDIFGKDWGVQDDKGKVHLVRYKTGAQSTNCSEYQEIEKLRIASLDPNRPVTFALRATGDIDPNVSFYFFTAAKTGRIDGARWQILKPNR